MKTDEILIQRIEELACGASCHRAANLIGFYRSAVRDFLRTEDPDYADIAREAEVALRRLLTELRLSRSL